MLVLHLGSPKTGTTALQEFLYLNAEALRHRGVNYMQAGRTHIAHNPLPQAIAAQDASGIIAAIAQEYAKNPEAVHVISSEIMFRVIVAGRFGDIFPRDILNETKIVCYLRRQDRYAEVLYKQLAKNAAVPADRPGFLNAISRKLRYSNVLDRYANLVGDGNLLAKPFDRSVLKNGDIVSDFASELLGIDDLSGFERPKFEANRTLSVELSEMLGAISADKTANTRELIRILSTMDDPRLFSSLDTFSLNDRRDLMLSLEDENATVCQRYAPSQTQLFDLADLDRQTEVSELDADMVRERLLSATRALSRALQTYHIAKAKDSAAITQSPTPAVQPTDGHSEDGPPSWFHEIAPAGPRTGFYHKMADHGVTFIDRGTHQLLVTFDNLHNVGDPRMARELWAEKFAADNGLSLLSVFANKPVWYRDQALISFFERLSQDGFFTQFENVTLAGSSMGGFAALSFAHLIPNATVLAFSPQTSLDNTQVPWEKRFAKGRAADWSLPLSDAANTTQSAKQVFVFYDPFLKADRAQVERLSGANIRLMRCPGYGHKTALVLNRMGHLKTILQLGVDGQLDAARFYQLSRDRKKIRIWLTEMMAHLTQRGHDARAQNLQKKFRAAIRAKK